MIMIKRFSFLFIVLITLGCIYTTSSFADPVPINFGEQVIFTDFNFNQSYFSPDPVNTIPP
jgi:hypothetical protein